MTMNAMKPYASVTPYHGESYTLWYVVAEDHDGPIASYRTRTEADAFASGWNTRITESEETQ